MENENSVRIADALAESLRATQNNATVTEASVVQVLFMAGKNQHDEIVTAIRNDARLSMEEKLDLIHRENNDYDLRQESCAGRLMRMQDTHAHIVCRATNWWSENWGWLVFAGITALTISTPRGQKLLATAVRGNAA